MTIWILTIVLLLSLAGLGYRQGAIRVGFSLVGIIIGGAAAMMLGHLLVPLWKAIGLKNPLLPWVLGPLTVFAIVMFIVKSAALVVHRRTYVHYKHHEGELRLSLWERLNRRLGLCLGLANGALYLMLASYAIYTPTYWTYQLGSATETSRTVKILNRMGADLQKTGLTDVAGAIKSMPDAYYDAGDIVGLIYNYPDLQGRLSRYPSFISLAERPELQDLANDPEVAAMRSGQGSVSQLIAHEKVQAILKNPELVESIRSTLVPDLKDLKSYLTNGLSAKYDGEKILGKWNFYLNGSYVLFSKDKPAAKPAEIVQRKNMLRTTFSSTTLVAGSDHIAVLRGIPRQGGNPGETETLTGKWESDGSGYKIRASFNGIEQEFAAPFDNGKLTIEIPGLPLVFMREE